MASTQNDVPLVELQLPETGDTVVMKTFLTTGQSRELQKVLLSKGKFDVQKGSFEDLDVAGFMEMQDKSAELLIKEVKDKDGNVRPFDQEWLYNLPQSDGQLVYDKVNELTGASVVSDEERKN